MEKCNPKIKEFNQLAIEHCELNRKTLIFILESNYIPSLKTICELREKVYFTESSDFFTKITENFDKFDTFILKESLFNNFEKEFFNQLKIKTKARIIELKN